MSLTETEKKIESMMEFVCDNVCKWRVMCTSDQLERKCEQCGLIAHNRAIILSYEKEIST